MSTLYGMIVKAFIPVLIVTMLFFILILQLVDVFTNLSKYINNDVPIFKQHPFFSLKLVMMMGLGVLINGSLSGE